MSFENIQFQTSDNVTLRGWFVTPKDVVPTSERRLPCLVMSHGFSAVKEMGLQLFATDFTTHLPISCLVFDNRGFGESDVGPGQYRQEITPSVQTSDISDAITYAQSRDDVDADRIGIWGSSFSGGNVLWVGAVDRRVKAVLSQVPLVNGWENWHRLVRADLAAEMNKAYQEDRLARASGHPPRTIPVISDNTSQLCALPGREVNQFMTGAAPVAPNWKNEVTLRTMENLRAYDPSALIHRISPTPLLMSIAAYDAICPADIALEAYGKAREPKELHLLPSGHFEVYSGVQHDPLVEAQIAFLRKWLEPSGGWGELERKQEG